MPRSLAALAALTLLSLGCAETSGTNRTDGDGGRRAASPRGRHLGASSGSAPPHRRLTLPTVDRARARALLAPDDGSDDLKVLVELLSQQRLGNATTDAAPAPTALGASSDEDLPAAEDGLPGLFHLLRDARGAGEPPASADAFAAVRDGRGIIFFRHMRKAGGTTVKSFLDRVVAAKAGVAGIGRSSLANQKPMPLTAQEWGVFPVSCLAREPRALFVTCLREPISRHVSEYWYAGPGNKNGNAAKSESSWKDWMDHIGGEIPPAPPTLMRGKYFDDYYVRALTGNCEPTKSQNPNHLKYTCGWGGAFGGGCRPDMQRRPTAADLEYAKAVLSLYDVVLVMEWLSRKDVNNYVQAALGLPSDLVIGHKRKTPVRASGGAHRSNPDPPDAIKRRLDEENAFDIDLYGFAKERASHDMEESRKAAAAPARRRQLAEEEEQARGGRRGGGGGRVAGRTETTPAGDVRAVGGAGRVRSEEKR